MLLDSSLWRVASLTLASAQKSARRSSRARPSTTLMLPWNASPVPTFLPRYVLGTSPLSTLTGFII